MNDNLQGVRGYRVLGDRPKDRQLSLGYLQQDGRSAKLLAELRTRAVTEGANCVGRAEEFSGEELPSDREAQLMCSSCPLYSLCEQYRETAHPAWGVWGGHVKGRKLKEMMDDA